MQLSLPGPGPTRANFKQDLFASIVVFLVALPLCMGVAVASGAPPATGIITGSVGGRVAGALAGCPLQVSGPAARTVPDRQPPIPPACRTTP